MLLLVTPMNIDNNNNATSGALVLIAFFLIGMAQALNKSLTKLQSGGYVVRHDINKTRRANSGKNARTRKVMRGGISGLQGKMLEKATGVKGLGKAMDIKDKMMSKASGLKGMAQSSGLKDSMMAKVSQAKGMAQSSGLKDSMMAKVAQAKGVANNMKAKAQTMPNRSASGMSVSPNAGGIVGQALDAMTWGFDTVKNLASGASKQALGFADARVGMLLSAITGGTQNKTIQQMTPQINKALKELSDMLQDMANSPQSRQLLEEFAQALTESAITMIKVAAPNLEKIAAVATNTASRVGSIAARRGIGAGINVAKTAIAMIPGVNVAFFSALLFISTLTGIIRVVLNTTTSATKISNLIANTIGKAADKAEGPVGNVAKSGRAIVDRAKSLMGGTKSKYRRNGRKGKTMKKRR